MNNKAKIALAGAAIVSLASGCSSARRISVEDSLSYAKTIYENKKAMDEESFSASSLGYSDNWYTAVDVRFQSGRYAYFSVKHYDADNKDASRVTRNDFYLFSNVAATTDSAGNIIELKEQYIFAVNTMSTRRQYNVISETRFDELLGVIEKENRAQFLKMEENAYDYLTRYDGKNSPISFASKQIAYAPSGNVNDLVLEGGDSQTYQSYFDTISFGDSIHELRDYTDVYSEYHSFKGGRPFQIDDSFTKNKIALSSYKAAFTYGNCATVSWDADRFTLTDTQLEFNPDLSLTLGE